MTRLFIDTHCHFFSAEHIPLSQSLERVEKQLFGSSFKTLLLSGGAAVLAPMAGPVGADLLKSVGRFVKFFDRPAAMNIEETISSLRKLHDYAIPQRKVVMTPLIMDFEQCVSYKTLKDQVDDLRRNIEVCRPFLESQNALILPFVGFDTRRLDEVAPENVKSFLQQHLADIGVEIEHFTREELSTRARNGDFIGIKLYPSLGGDLYPGGDNPSQSQQMQRARHRAFAAAVTELNIPVTVHCQLDSYECGDPKITKKTLDNFANPLKWQKILQATPEARNIRLNLAHFGGEDGVMQTIRWSDDFDVMDEGGGVPKAQGFAADRGWTYAIIEMIKQYPNIYSDLGAFRFPHTGMSQDAVKRADKAAASLQWLMHYDASAATAMDGEHKLVDKLMWGTDIPMTLFDIKNYKQQFSAFATSMNAAGYDSHYQLPRVGDAGVLPFEQLLQRLVDSNPSQFLFAE